MEPTVKAGNAPGSIEEMLQSAQRQLQRARVHRLAVIERARREGVSWPKIAEQLGISDVAARRLHARNS